MWSLTSCLCCFLGYFRKIDEGHKKPFVKVAKRRQCTDVFWMIVFMAFLAAFIFLGYFSRNVGDVSRFFYAADSFGNQCGSDNPGVVYAYGQNTIGKLPLSGSDVQNKWYSFPLDMSQPSNSAWICVNECPLNQYSKWEELEKYLKQLSQSQSICFYDFNITSRNISVLDSSQIGPCPVAPVYTSKSSQLNRCIPSSMNSLPSSVISSWVDLIEKEDIVRQIFADVYNNLLVYVLVCAFSIGTSFAISCAMIWKNKKTVYVLYVLSLPLGIAISIVLIFSSVYNFAKSYFLESTELGLGPNAEWFLNGSRVDYALLSFLGVTAATFTLFAWIITWTIIKPRSHLVTELFLQVRKPIKCMLWLLPEAFLNFVLSVLFLVFWVWILANLLSGIERDVAFLSIWKRASIEQESAIPVFRANSPPWLKYALMFHVLAFLWINAFLADVQKFVVAYAASTWYFDTSVRRSWSLVYLRAVLFFWRYHIGSLAFGSLLLLMFRIPSHIYLFLSQRFKLSRNNFVAGLYRRLRFCLKDFEQLMRSIHVNAYAVVATNGEDFLCAGKTAANLWQDNSWYMLTTNTVAALLFTLTKCSFALVVGFVCGCYFRAQHEVVYWLLPTLICTWLAYYIMNQFLTLFEMIIETLFLCYACEIDDSDPTCQKTPKMIVTRANYGFNKYMLYRIQEERCLNNSKISPRRTQLYLSTIGAPTPRPGGAQMTNQNGNDSTHVGRSTSLVSLDRFDRMFI